MGDLLRLRRTPTGLELARGDLLLGTEEDGMVSIDQTACRSVGLDPEDVRLHFYGHIRARYEGALAELDEARGILFRVQRQLRRSRMIAWSAVGGLIGWAVADIIRTLMGG